MIGPDAGPRPVRVAVVDDQALMRSAFATILGAAGLDVVGEAGDGDGAVALARDARPDVVLMDVRMPGRDGIDATAEIVATFDDVRVLVLTTFDGDDHLYGALRAGASGFLLKNSSPEDLVRAVRLVAAGDSVLDPAVTARVVTRAAAVGDVPAVGSGTEPDRSGIDRLTEREKDVLRLLTRGRTNAEIAGDLGVGEATAKTHVSRVLMKLGVRDRVQAVILAYECGFALTGRDPLVS